MSNSGALSDYPNAYSSVADVERLEQERRDQVVGNPNDSLNQGDTVSDQANTNPDEPSDTEDQTTNEGAPIAGTTEVSGDGEAHDGGTVTSTPSDHENTTGS